MAQYIIHTLSKFIYSHAEQNIEIILLKYLDK